MSWFEQLRREALLAARASSKDDGNGGGGDLENKWVRDTLLSSSSPVNDVHVFATDRQVRFHLLALDIFFLLKLYTYVLPLCIKLYLKSGVFLLELLELEMAKNYPSF